MTIGLDFDYNLERDLTHEADIWLTYEQPTQADLIASKLATIHFAVYASQSHIQRHGIPSTMVSPKNHRVVEHVSPGVRSELLDVLIGTERPQGFIAMRTNSSLSQLWSVIRGGYRCPADVCQRNHKCCGSRTSGIENTTGASPRISFQG
jgi:DNA-binding transcriptional LysR family regulator